MRWLRDWFFLLTHPRERAMIRFLKKHAPTEPALSIIIDDETYEYINEFAVTNGYSYADEAVKNGFIGTGA